MTKSECLTCQIEAKRTSGIEITNAERNHWMLWGCTCTTDAATEAREFVSLVTR